MAHFLRSWIMLFVNTILITTEQAFAPSPIYGRRQQLGPTGSKKDSEATVLRLGAPMSKNAVSPTHTLDPPLSTQQGNGKKIESDLSLKKGELNMKPGYGLQTHQGSKGGEMLPQQNGVMSDGQTKEDVHHVHQLSEQESQQPQTALQETQPTQLTTQNAESPPKQAQLVTKPLHEDQQQDNKKNENNNNNNCGGGCGCCCGAENCGTNNNNDGKNNGQGDNNCCGCCCCCQPCCCSPCGCCCQPCCCQNHECCVHHVHHVEHHQCPCPCAPPYCCECACAPLPCGPYECLPPCCSGGYGYLDPLNGGCGGCCGCSASYGCGGWSRPCGCGGYNCNIFVSDHEKEGEHSDFISVK